MTHAYEEIMAALPPIHGFRIRTVPAGLNEIGQMRFDAEELGELSAHLDTEETIDRPGAEIDEYRLRLDRARRDLVRERISELTARIDHLVQDLLNRTARDRAVVSDPQWEKLVPAFGELERLAGSQIPRTKAWLDLQRHLVFGPRELTSTTSPRPTGQLHVPKSSRTSIPSWSRYRLLLRIWAR